MVIGINLYLAHKNASDGLKMILQTNGGSNWYHYYLYTLYFYILVCII